MEIDGLLWQPGWRLTPAEIYNAEHTRLIGVESWIIDGLGQLESIPERLARATDIVLVNADNHASMKWRHGVRMAL